MLHVTHTLMKSLKKFVLKMAMPTQDGQKTSALLPQIQGWSKMAYAQSKV